jgi:hypothetical protein
MVRLGTQHQQIPDEGYADYQIVDIITHKYTTKSNYNDIALLRTAMIIR